MFGLILALVRCAPEPVYGQPIVITNRPIERALTLSNAVNVINTNFANLWRDFTNYSLQGLNTNLTLEAERVLVTASDKRTTNALASIAEVNRLVGVTGGVQTNLDARLPATNGTAPAGSPGS